MVPVFLRLVRHLGGDPPTGSDQGTVQDERIVRVVALQRIQETGRLLGQEADGLARVQTGRCCGYLEPGTGECLSTLHRCTSVSDACLKQPSLR